MFFNVFERVKNTKTLLALIGHHTAPYHAAFNGLAERAVQTFKEGMKMSKKESLETRVSRFLLKYRITPHSTTGIAPAELLMSRKPRSRLDVLHLDVRQRVQNQQKKQKELHDQHAVDRQWTICIIHRLNFGLDKNFITA
jgi:hypothetical protein